MSDLPTKPGAYYWRKSDGDEWEIHTVFIDDELNHTLMALCPIDDTWYATENRGGQWLPIPTAEELVELQAKKTGDEGQDGWATLSEDGQWITVGESRMEALRDFCCRGNRNFSNEDVERLWKPNTQYGYTCEPVTITRKAKR